MTVKRLHAVLMASLVAVLSCGDTQPVGVEDTPRPSRLDVTGSLTGLLACSPLPYDSVTQTIGEAGGLLQVGPHTLSVPAGALSAPTAITAVTPADSVSRIRFRPEGLTFAQPASLTMSYASCDLLGLETPKQIAYVSGALAILEYLVSDDDAESRAVTARLWHFSGYAVAW